MNNSYFGILGLFIEKEFGPYVLDTLNKFDEIYDKLSIDPYNVIDDIDEYNFETTLMEGILVQAVTENIIPEEWDFDKWFKIEKDYFICIPPIKYNKDVEDIVDKFIKWSNIDMKIKWKLI